MDLEFGLGEPEPAHATKMIAAFPGAEDFFDARPDRPQRAVVRFERFGGQKAMALAQKPRGAARGDDRLFDRQGVIGAIGINLARLIGNDRGGDRNIRLIGRRRLDFPDEAAVLVGGDMGLVAMRGGPRAMPGPGGVLIGWPSRSPSRR